MLLKPLPDWKHFSTHTRRAAVRKAEPVSSSAPFLDPSGEQKPSFTAVTSSSSLGGAGLLRSCCQARSPSLRGSRLGLAGKADPAAKAQLCVGSAQELQFMNKLSLTLLSEYIQIWAGGGAGGRSQALRKGVWFFFSPRCQCRAAPGSIPAQGSLKGTKSLLHASNQKGMGTPAWVFHPSKARKVMPQYAELPLIHYFPPVF